MVFLTKLKPEPMGAHSLSVAYGVNSLVMSGDGAAAYISVKDVPAGTPLTNTDYWQPHTDLTAVRQSAEAAAQKANAARDEMMEIARSLTDAVEKSGNPVRAELVVGLPFDRVAMMLEPIQSGSGDPSPTNIRPITGWTGAELNHSNAAGVEYTYAADFGQTVYGGTLNWQTGVMTVDRGYKALDGTENWSRDSNGFYSPLDGLNKAYDYMDAITCSHMPTAKSHNTFGGVSYAVSGYHDEKNSYPTKNWLYAKNTATPTVDDWKAYLAAQYAAGTPVQIAYKLATPTTIQLTSQEIKQLQGVNTLYGDGSISIVGRANPALALDARIAALEAAATEI